MEGMCSSFPPSPWERNSPELGNSFLVQFSVDCWDETVQVGGSGSSFLFHVVVLRCFVPLCCWSFLSGLPELFWSVDSCQIIGLCWRMRLEVSTWDNGDTFYITFFVFANGTRKIVTYWKIVSLTFFQKHCILMEKYKSQQQTSKFILTNWTHPGNQQRQYREQ